MQEVDKKLVQSTKRRIRTQLKKMGYVWNGSDHVMEFPHATVSISYQMNHHGHLYQAISVFWHTDHVPDPLPNHPRYHVEIHDTIPYMDSPPDAAGRAHKKVLDWMERMPTLEDALAKHEDQLDQDVIWSMEFRDLAGIPTQPGSWTFTFINMHPERPMKPEAAESRNIGIELYRKRKCLPPIPSSDSSSKTKS